ncbi:MAG: hypothetical protein AB1490_10555 [Pseudomonadota bacterium]
MVKTILLAGAMTMSATMVSAQPAAPGRPLNEAQLCASFKQAGNGCWQPTSTITITSRNGQVAFPRGSITCPGQPTGGVDIATALNRRCLRQ